MGWEHRKGEQTYFYRSVRTPRGPRKIYFGSDDEAAAMEAELIARCRERHRERSEIEAMREVAQAAARLADAGRLLLRLWMTANGFHQHRGQWRRRRG